MTKYVDDKRPYADPAKAAERLIEIAKTLRNDKGRMPVGEWNSTFLKGGNVAEYTAGRDKLIADGVIQMHECGGVFMWKDDDAAHLKADDKCQS
jgi:hypothetical protein